MSGEIQQAVMNAKSLRQARDMAHDAANAQLKRTEHEKLTPHMEKALLDGVKAAWDRRNDRG